jgi:hypothetical protein
MLWALLLGGLFSCAQGDEQTCLAVAVTYSGTKTAAAYIKILSDDGGRSFSSTDGPYQSIQDLILIENGGVTCFGGGPRPDIPITGNVWIDVSGAGAVNCSPSAVNPLCQPSPTDSQGSQSAVLRYGQLTRMPFAVVDRP